jgi:hypothetical protein
MRQFSLTVTAVPIRNFVSASKVEVRSALYPVMIGLQWNFSLSGPADLMVPPFMLIPQSWVWPVSVIFAMNCPGPQVSIRSSGVAKRSRFSPGERNRSIMRCYDMLNTNTESWTISPMHARSTSWPEICGKQSGCLLLPCRKTFS